MPPKLLFADPRFRSPTKSEMCSFVKTLRPFEVWEPACELSIRRIFVWPDESFARGEYHERGSLQTSFASRISVKLSDAQTMRKLEQERLGNKQEVESFTSSGWKVGLEQFDVLSLMRSSNDMTIQREDGGSEPNFGDQKVDLATQLMNKIQGLEIYQQEIGSNVPTALKERHELPIKASELVITLIDFITKTEQMVSRRSPGFVLQVPILMAANDMIKFEIIGTNRHLEESSRIIELRGISKRDIP